MAINVSLHKKLPYDPAADFVPLALVVSSLYVLVVTPSLPARSVSDLVKLARDGPGGSPSLRLGQVRPIICFRSCSRP